jgi:hypothetical protein
VNSDDKIRESLKAIMAAEEKLRKLESEAKLIRNELVSYYDNAARTMRAVIGDKCEQGVIYSSKRWFLQAGSLCCQPCDVKVL